MFRNMKMRNINLKEGHKIIKRHKKMETKSDKESVSRQTFRQKNMH